MVLEEKKQKKAVWMADILCLLVAAIWGSGFIASQAAIDAQMSAPLIMALRFSVAAVVMLLVCLPRLKQIRVEDLKRGGLAGLFLFGAFYTQIVGQQNTTVSHCAFLTATNVVMVPFLVWAVSRRRPQAKTFVLALTTLVGIGVLSIQPGSFEISFHYGDAMTLLCAVLFALHITTLGWAVKGTDVMRINLIQLSTAAIVSVAVFLLTDLESVSQANFASGFPAVLYLGLFSTCLCYFLQTLAQKHTTPSQAGILLSTEGLFGSLFSVLIGLEPLTVNLVAGGLLITASVVLMEVLPSPKSRRTKENAS